MFDKYYSKVKSVLGLSIALAKAEFKLRNEGSYLGILWYLLSPVLMFILLFLVFSDRLGNDIPQYPLYLLMGVIMFNFFQNSTIECVGSILNENRSVIKAINFPRESLPISIVIKNLFSHLFEILLFILLFIFFKLSLINILYYFFILFFFCLFIFGVSLILASLTVYFVDMESIWAFAVRVLWLATPIFYAIGGQTRLFYLNLFNPVYYFITFARDVVIYGRLPETLITCGSIFYSLLFFIVGLMIFNTLKTKFAEKI
jgi:ABC-type polysaccharide/polyol phosphate export permease